MTKPTIDDTRFGETGGGTPAGTLSAPASGRKDTGYVNGDVPPPGEHSWLWQKAHLWFKYLNGLIDGSENWTFPANVKIGGVSGDTYGVRTRQYFPTAWLATGTAPTLVANPAAAFVPVWKLPTAQTVMCRIPFDVKDVVTSVRYEVYGDGACDWTANLAWSAAMDGTGGFTISSDSYTNTAASWANVASAGIFGSGDALPAAAVLNLQIILTGGTQLYFGMLELGIRRI